MQVHHGHSDGTCSGGVPVPVRGADVRHEHHTLPLLRPRLQARCFPDLRGHSLRLLMVNSTTLTNMSLFVEVVNEPYPFASVVQDVLHSGLGSSTCRCKPEQNPDQGPVLFHSGKCDVQAGAEELVCRRSCFHVHHHVDDRGLLRSYRIGPGGRVYLAVLWSIRGWPCLHLKLLPLLCYIS